MFRLWEVVKKGAVQGTLNKYGECKSTTIKGPPKYVESLPLGPFFGVLSHLFT